MSDPKPTRREFNKFLAALPLAAVPVAKAAATLVPEPTPPASTDSPDVLRMADMVAQAVARRPLRLYGRDPHRVWLAEWQTDCRERLDGYSWARKAIKGPGPVIELQDHPLVKAAHTCFHELPADRKKVSTSVYMAAFDLSLGGAAYWLMIPNSFNVPAEVCPLPAHHVMEIRESGKFDPTGYRFRPVVDRDFGPINRPQDVVRFRRTTVADPYGMQPIRPEDTVGLKVKTWDKHRVANAYGIPLAMLDARETRRNADRAEGQFQRHAVDPICRIIASSLTRWTHRHPLAASRGWDRLVWAFDEVETNP